jgi:hypothetical protein
MVSTIISYGKSFKFYKNMYEFEGLYKEIYNSELFKHILDIKQISKEDILKAYILLGKDILPELKDYISVDTKYKKFIRDVFDNIYEFQNEIENIKHSSLKEDNFLKYYEEIDIKDIKCGSFNNNRFKILSKLIIEKDNKPILNLLELFNYIILNENVPCVICNDFFKIYSRFSQKGKIDKWYDEIENKDNLYIIIKINDKYINIIVSKNFEIEYEYDKDTEENDIIKIFRTIFNEEINITLKDRKSIGLYGHFDIVFDKKSFNRYVMSELIMNNTYVSYYLTNDESKKTDKEKYNVRYNNMKTKLTFQISSRDSKNIRITISSKLMTNIEEFQNIFSKITVIYMKEYDNVIKYYGEYINIEKEIVEEIKDDNLECEKLLKGSNCKKPVILKSGEEFAVNSNQILINIKNNCKFICNDDEYKYPGIKDNKLCCYKKDKTEKVNVPGSEYRIFTSIEEYNKYNEEDINEENEKEDVIVINEKSQSHYIKNSNSILSNDKTGELPKVINNFFNDNTNEEYKYKRIGMHKSANSFIQCIHKATNSDIEYKDLRSSDDFIKNVNLCKQECYNESFEQIVELLKNEEEYFDPKKFIRLLEDFFNVNIFIFQRNRENEEKLILPEHTKQYFKFKNNKANVFILEHYGTSREEKKMKYPQCELIVLWNIKDEEYIYKFEKDDEIVLKTMSVYNKLNNIKYIDNEGFDFEENTFNGYKILYQVFDTYGKTRIIILKVDDSSNYISLYFRDPIPPLNTESISLEESYEFDLDDKNQINKLKNISDIKIINDKIYGKILNYQVYFILRNNDVNLIKNYNKMKRITRYVINHLFWLYSIYINENDTDNLDDFIDKNIIIDRSFEYEEIPNNTLSYESNIIGEENKLIIKSEETLERLIYVLKLKIVREYKDLLSFKDKKSMDDYYIDITDFDEHPNNILLKGFDYVKWINDSKKINRNYMEYSIVKPERKSVYFLNLFNDSNVYAVVNKDTFEDAVKIGYFWNINQYIPQNISKIDININNLKINFYSYVNKKDIEKYIINNEGNDYNINIIGYKYKDETGEEKGKKKKEGDNIKKKFTVLLETLL